MIWKQTSLSNFWPGSLFLQSGRNKQSPPLRATYAKRILRRDDTWKLEVLNEIFYEIFYMDVTFDIGDIYNMIYAYLFQIKMETIKMCHLSNAPQFKRLGISSKYYENGFNQFTIY